MELFTAQLYSHAIQSFGELKKTSINIPETTKRIRQLNYGEYTGVGFSNTNGSLHSQISKTHVSVVVTHPELQNLTDDEFRAVISTSSLCMSWCMLMLRKSLDTEQIFRNLTSGKTEIGEPKVPGICFTHTLHRDAKASNIALFSSFMAFVSDFILTNILSFKDRTELIRTCGRIRADLEVLTQ